MDAWDVRLSPLQIFHRFAEFSSEIENSSQVSRLPDKYPISDLGSDVLSTAIPGLAELPRGAVPAVPVPPLLQVQLQNTQVIIT